MVSKTRKQRQKKATLLEENGGVLPLVTPSQPASIHTKKTRPHMKSKQKIRLGHDCPVNIYEGFEDHKGVLWRCPNCKKECRVVGFCVDCATGVKSSVHSGITMSRNAPGSAKKSGTIKTKILGKKKIKAVKKK